MGMEIPMAAADIRCWSRNLDVCFSISEWIQSREAFDVGFCEVKQSCMDLILVFPSQAGRRWKIVCSWTLFSDTHSMWPLADWRHAGLHFLLDKKSENYHQQGESSNRKLCNSLTLVFVQFVNVSLWVLSIGTMTAILVGMQPLQSTEKPASRIANALWIALIRNNWGYSIAWIIFACHHGTGGIIKWFLELPCWQPLGRMSLSFYLVHSIYQTVVIGSGKAPLHFSQRALVVYMSWMEKFESSYTISIHSFTTMLVTSSFRFFLQQFSIWLSKNQFCWLKTTFTNELQWKTQIELQQKSFNWVSFQRKKMESKHSTSFILWFCADKIG